MKRKYGQFKQMAKDIEQIANEIQNTYPVFAEKLRGIAQELQHVYDQTIGRGRKIQIPELGIPFEKFYEIAKIISVGKRLPTTATVIAIELTKKGGFATYDYLKQRFNAFKHTIIASVKHNPHFIIREDGIKLDDETFQKIKSVLEGI
jgi:hypothetical protein